MNYYVTCFLDWFYSLGCKVTYKLNMKKLNRWFGDKSHYVWGNPDGN